MYSKQPEQKVSVAMAIIYQEGRYLMQLRDEIPQIVYPGVWGLFGGHIEPEELPEKAIKRELIEEINYSVKHLNAFCCSQAGAYIRHIFHCPLICSIEDLELKEGWDMKLVTLPEIQNGFSYSDKAKASKPLGDIHRKILLEFTNSKSGY